MAANQTPPPTEDSEIARAKTMFVITPAPPPLQPQFHYDHYFKVRDREAAEIKLRRDRQLEILKWTSALLIATVAAIPNIVHGFPTGWFEIVSRVFIAIIVLLICYEACKRIRHDAKLAHFRAKICHAMDEGVGYQFDDRMLKKGGLTYGQANVFCWFLVLLSLVICVELIAIPLNLPSSYKEEKKEQRAKADIQTATPSNGDSKTKISDAKGEVPMTQSTAQ